MIYEKKPVVIKWDGDPMNLYSWERSFETVLETTFERLEEKQIQYNIRRIREMDEELTRLEMELDEFIGSQLRREKVCGHNVNHD
jgi:hypothetical protein